MPRAIPIWLSMNCCFAIVVAFLLVKEGNLQTHEINKLFKSRFNLISVVSFTCPPLYTSLDPLTANQLANYQLANYQLANQLANSSAKS
jgi:hypothetical protein